MSTQAQIEADAALARRLQEEEFAAQLPRADWAAAAAAAAAAANAPPHARRHAPPSAAPRGATRAPQQQQHHQQQQHQQQQHQQQPHYPQPSNHWPQPPTAPPRSHNSAQPRFPFAQGRPTFDLDDMFSIMLRTIAEHGGGVPHAMTALNEMAHNNNASPRRSRAPPRAESSFNSILEDTFGRLGDSQVRGAAFTLSPDGVHFERLHPHAGRASRAGGAGASRPSRARNNRAPMADVFDMMSIMLPGRTGAFGNGADGGGGGGGGGGAHTFADMFRTLFPGGAVEGGETYEDWLSLIERMGGNVERGGTDEEINQLPTHAFRRGGGGGGGAEAQAGGNKGEDKGEDEADKCAICLGEYEEGDAVKTLPCAHRFHGECVDQWLRVNRICPFCKQSIRGSDGAPGAS